ncbi:MAG TPA: alginate lyase family protein [Terriglobales bacterium]
MAYADAVCDGQFPWFAYGPVKLGLPPRWDFDFVSGKSWPKTRSENLQVVRHDGSDVKVPWELSRMQFLPVLGKAWRLSGDQRYRAAGKDLLSDWIEKNPSGAGVNWTIAMEAALRAMSICFFLELALPWGADDAPWLRQVTSNLWKHLLFIEAHNEFSHLSRSNHYLSNVVGLLCLSSYLDGPQMKARRRLYANLVGREMFHQVYEDGGDFEASFGYHLLVLQMFTSAFLLMKAQGTGPTEEFSERLKRMYKYVAALADPQGRLAHVGDCDDGRVELLTDDLETMMALENRYSLRVADQLGIGEALFDMPGGSPADDAVCYANVDRVTSVGNDTVAENVRVFRNSGVAVVKSSDAEAVFLAIPNGMAGKGSHTHNDKLSVLLNLGNHHLFVDSGCAGYTRNASLRNRFRATAAHNTIQIDDEEQNRFSKSPGGLFSISDDAQLSPITMENLDGEVVLSASHDGYHRLGIIHKRIMRWNGQRQLTLDDELTGYGKHTFAARFHLPSHCQIAIRQDCGELVSCSIHGPSRVTMTFRAASELSLSSDTAQTSSAFGSISESGVIVVSGTFIPPFTLYSAISWEDLPT